MREKENEKRIEDMVLGKMASSNNDVQEQIDKKQKEMNDKIKNFMKGKIQDALQKKFSEIKQKNQNANKTIEKLDGGKKE